jgi:hypothetical protein
MLSRAPGANLPPSRSMLRSAIASSSFSSGDRMSQGTPGWLAGKTSLPPRPGAETVGVPRLLVAVLLRPLDFLPVPGQTSASTAFAGRANSVG